MVIYRILRTLDAGGRGQLHPPGPTALEWLNEEQKKKLVEVGAVSELHAPPLGELPGWKTRAKALKKVGISTVNEFMLADETELAKALKKRGPTIAKWKADIARLLMVKWTKK